MRNARLDDSQAGIKIPGTNINNLRHGDDTTLMAESEEELKSLWMKMKEESEKAGIFHSTFLREGNGNLLQYSCLKTFHGQRSLLSYSPWGRKS